MSIRVLHFPPLTTAPRQTLEPTHDLRKHPVPRTPDGVFADVDAVWPDTVLAVDDDGERNDGRGDRGECGRCRDHEHDDHLQPCCLFDRRTSEDSTGHHAGYRDDTNDAVYTRTHTHKTCM